MMKIDKREESVIYDLKLLDDKMMEQYAEVGRKVKLLAEEKNEVIDEYIEGLQRNFKVS